MGASVTVSLWHGQGKANWQIIFFPDPSQVTYQQYIVDALASEAGVKPARDRYLTL